MTEMKAVMQQTFNSECVEIILGRNIHNPIEKEMLDWFHLLNNSHMYEQYEICHPLLHISKMLELCFSHL